MEERIINHFLNYWGKDLIKLDFTEENEKNRTGDLDEQIKFIFKSPYERPYVDFKSELSLDEKYKEAEMLKDLIALANSSYSNNNVSYIIVGVMQENNRITQISNVTNSNGIEQKITQLSQLLNKDPGIECDLINIHKLFLWQDGYEISGDIPFTEEQTHPDNKQEILVIKIIRTKGCVYELARDFPFLNKKGKNDCYDHDTSWIRISSHTYKLQEHQREILRNN